MNPDGHRSQLIKELPPSKRALKRTRTVTGILLVGFGILAAVTSFAVTLILVSRGGTIDKWSVILTGLPFLGGLVMCVLGAHVWSGEYVSAALKDIGAAARIWRKNGGK